MKKIKSQRGQSLVELSISLVLLLILLSGAVEFGMAFFQFVQLQDAAQEGALYGSMNPSDTPGIMNRIQGASNSPVNLAGAGVTIAISIDGVSSTDTANYSTIDCEGHGLKVDVIYQHQIFMPFLPQILGGNSSFPLHASVTDTILSPVKCMP
jgi:TadE-like protein/Prokaryotic N-terminal methylation motif